MAFFRLLRYVILRWLTDCPNAALFGFNDSLDIVFKIIYSVLIQICLLHRHFCQYFKIININFIVFRVIISLVIITRCLGPIRYYLLLLFLRRFVFVLWLMIVNISKILVIRRLSHLCKFWLRFYRLSVFCIVEIDVKCNPFCETLLFKLNFSYWYINLVEINEKGFTSYFLLLAVLRINRVILFWVYNFFRHSKYFYFNFAFIGHSLFLLKIFL